MFGQTVYALILPILSVDWVDNHGIEHWDVISKLLRCVKGTINFGFTYCDYLAILKEYCDANCIFNSDEQCQLMAIMCLLWLKELSLKVLKVNLYNKVYYGVSFLGEGMN